MRSVLPLLLLLPVIAHADPARRDLYGDPLPEGAIQRLGTARMKHPGATRVSVAPDGETVVTLGGDRHVRVWSARTGKLLKALPYPPQVNTSDRPHFSADGLRYVNIDKQVVQVWDVENLKVTHRLPLKGVDRLTAVAFSSDPNVIATAEDTPREYRIRVWDLKKGTNREVGHTESRVSKLGFVGPTRILTCTDDDPALHFSSQLWDLEDSNRDRFFPCIPMSSFLPPNNPWVAMIQLESDTSDWELWDLRRDERVETLPFDKTVNRRVGVSPDGSRLLTLGTEGAALLDRKTKKALASFPRWSDFAFSADAKHLYLLENSALLRKIDAASGKSLWESSDPVGTSEPFDLQWFPDSRFVLTTYFLSGGASVVHDSCSGKAVATLKATEKENHQAALPFLSAPREGVKIFSSTRRGVETRSWRAGKLGEPEVMPFPSPPAEWRTALALTPDGKRFRSVHRTPKGTTTFLQVDLESNEVRHQREDPELHVQFAGYNYSGFSRDARLFRYGSDLFFPDTGESVPPRDGQAGVLGMTLSDRTDLVAANPTRELPAPEGSTDDPVVRFDLRIWERFTGRTLVEFKDTHTVRRAFHPSGRFLATDHPDGVRVWNLLSGEPERLIPCHDATFNDSRFGTYAYCLAFSPDGTKLATGHGDTTVLIWDTSDLPPAPRERLDAATIEKLWQTLRESDAKQAWAAHWKLAGSPETVLPFLQEHLRPVRAVTRKESQPLLDQLESKDFRKRESAMKKVDELDEAFLPLVQELLRGDLGEDLRKRLAPIPEKKRWNVPPTGEDLRLMRAVRLLEAIGGAESLRLVEKLSEGAATGRATQEAVAARERMRHGKGSE